MFLTAFLTLLLLLAIVIGVVAIASAYSRIRSLERDLLRLRADLGARGLGSDAPSPEPSPTARPVLAPVLPAEPPKPRIAPDAAPEPPPGARTTPVPEPAQPHTVAPSAEEVFGAFWLQNVGSVLVLLGVFFLILWGYTTHRFGPGVLVAAGVAFGGFVAWRGDRMRRSVPAFGTTLIGIGLGVSYLSLYAGHFQLRVLSTPSAFVALATVSIAGIVAGLYYRVVAIAMLGVIGAFIPPIASTLLRIQSFGSVPGALLGYFAFVNLAVIVLAARRNWKSLDLLALGLTLVAWIVAIGTGPWDLGTELGLLALFTLLGLVPVFRLARDAAEPDLYDLGITLFAPIAVLLSSWPYFASTPRTVVASLLFGLSLAHGLAAAALERRVPRRELWRTHTAWATIFLTGALERWFGPTWTTFVWSIEGVLLVALGLTPRGGWFRALGYAIGALTALISLPGFLLSMPWTALPGESILTPDSIRALVIVLAFFVAGSLLHRHRSLLAEGEQRLASEMWTAAGNTFLALWTLPHAARLASWIAIPSSAPGSHTGGEWFAALGSNHPLSDWQSALVAFGWLLQAAVLLLLGVRGSPFLRALGYGLAMFGGAVLLLGHLAHGHAGGDQLLFLRPTGVLRLAGIAIPFALASVLSSVRARDADRDIAPAESDALTILGHLLLAGVLGHEGSQVARALGVEPAGGFARLFVACAWLAQSGVLVATGLLGGSLSLRVLGYVGTIAAAIATFPGIYYASQGAAGPPFLHPAGAPDLLVLLGLVGGAEFLARSRDALTPEEKWMPEVLTLLATLLWLVLSVAEAGRLAADLRPESAEAMRAGLASAGWLASAIVLFALGWRRHAPFLRRLGLVLFALTVIKFLVYDLTQVDTFWRFVVAVAAGAALLGVSYVYQRARRSARENP